jgi:hypothetical protein
LGEYLSTIQGRDNVTYTLIAAPLEDNLSPTEFGLSLIILPYKNKQSLDSIIIDILGKPSGVHSETFNTWEITGVGIITVRGLNIIHFQTHQLFVNSIEL